MIPYLLFVVGFGILILGAKYLVDGSSSLGIKAGFSQMLIGLSIVALGTSLPELIINVFASVQGSTGLAIGNVLGSNIMNTLLIIGVAAVLYPIKVSRDVSQRDSIINLFSILFLFVLANDTLLGKSSNLISRFDGFILLALFFAFLYIIFGNPKKHKTTKEVSPEFKTYSYFLSSIMIVGGVVGLYFGGKWIVDGATIVAKDLGMSESTIGMTIIAMATSLPELVTSIVAALKKNTDIAIGNALGSNIFNIFLVLGTSAVITPISFNTGLNADIIILFLASTLVIFTIKTGKTSQTITRLEGVLLMAIYIVFFVWTILK